MADDEHRVPEINVENVRQAHESTERVRDAARGAIGGNQDADDDVPDIPTKTQPEAEPPIGNP
jgi:hypothetical protein